MGKYFYYQEAFIKHGKCTSHVHHMFEFLGRRRHTHINVCLKNCFMEMNNASNFLICACILEKTQFP